MARTTEALTALLIGVNARYKVHAGDHAQRAAREAVGVSDSRRDIVLLSGGTGGAKLALRHRRGARPRAAVGDRQHRRRHRDLRRATSRRTRTSSPSGWPALIDERGWGLRGDTFAVMDGLRELGEEVWFNLGDRDLAWCIERAALLAERQHARPPRWRA